jgi:hypothetical protein
MIAVFSVHNSECLGFRFRFTHFNHETNAASFSAMLFCFYRTTLFHSPQRWHDIFSVVVISISITISQSSLFWDVSCPRLVMVTYVTSNYSSTTWPFQMGLVICCTKTPETNYQPMLCNILEEWIPQLHHGRSLKSCNISQVILAILRMGWCDKTSNRWFSKFWLWLDFLFCIIPKYSIIQTLKCQIWRCLGAHRRKDFHVLYAAGLKK